MELISFRLDEPRLQASRSIHIGLIWNLRKKKTHLTVSCNPLGKLETSLFRYRVRQCFHESTISIPYWLEEEATCNTMPMPIDMATAERQNACNFR